MSIRPLIKVTNFPNDTYLPNTATYTPAEAGRIKRFIPKFLSLVGVDHHGNPQEKKQQLEKQKLKVKAVSGKDTVQEAQLKFIKQKDISVKIWDNVAVCVNIPFNNRQSADDQKEQLDSKIELYIENQLYFVDGKGEEISQSSKNQFPLKDIQVYFHPAQLNAENFDNSYREVRVNLSIGAILPRKQAYTVQQLQESIKTDLINSLKIMIRNKLPIRILRSAISSVRVLILQSFVAKADEIQGQSNKLDELLNKPMGNQIGQQQRQMEPQQQPFDQQAVPRKGQLTNRQLMLILLGLFFIYLFLKINPIDKFLSEAL